METAVNNAINAIKAAKLVILVDDVSDNRNAYLVAAASSITSEDVCDMVNIAKGIVCAAMSENRIKRLHLPMMVPQQNPDLPFRLTVSVEARRGVSTGISASDRARTLRTLAGTSDPRRDLVMPGHIFPISAKNGGVLVRGGVAEAAADLLALAELLPVAALCHCLNQDGEYLNESEIENLKQKTGYASVSISDLIGYRMSRVSLIEKVSQAEMPVKNAGIFKAVVFKSLNDDAEHIALVKGDINLKGKDGKQLPVLVRVQAENKIGDLLGVNQTPSRQFIDSAIAQIAKEERGVLVYVRHPRKELVTKQVKEIAKPNKNKAENSQLMQTGIGAQILISLGVKRIRLLSNSERTIPGIKAFDLEIVEHVKLGIGNRPCFSGHPVATETTCATS